MTCRLFTCEALSCDEETRHQSQLLRLLWRGTLYETLPLYIIRCNREITNAI